MLSLNLEIENFNSLPDGGPVNLQLVGKGAQVGRRQSMDWILPDPTRHISGHHLDIIFAENAYYLQDVSRNGTFLHGERHRMGGPREIRSGDRFVVGQYVIRAFLSEVQEFPAANVSASPRPVAVPPAQVAAAPPPAAAPAPAPAPVAPPPVPPVAARPEPAVAEKPEEPARPATPPAGLQVPGGRLQTPGGGGLAAPPHARKSTGPQQPDLSKLQQGGRGSKGLSVPPGQDKPDARSGGLSAPPSFPKSGSEDADKVAEAKPDPQPAPVPEADADKTLFSSPPRHPDIPVGPNGLPLDTVVPEVPGLPLGAKPAEPVAAVASKGSIEEFVQAFCDGAGVANPAQLGMPPTELARMLGQCARVVTDEMMRMLQERAALKLFMAGEDRTMRSANGNNPMKFMADADQAFEIMFLQPKDGYMNGADGFANSLAEVRAHQAAVLAALQPALAEMVDGLAPEDIEKSVGGGVMGGTGRKCWDEYSERWKARASQGEYGLLDEFVKAFSKHYSDALKKSG